MSSRMEIQEEIFRPKSKKPVTLLFSVIINLGEKPPNKFGYSSFHP